MAGGFAVTDYLGRQVTLSDANWQAHIAKRPELVPFGPHLPLTLQAPEVVITFRGQEWFYRRTFPILQLRRVWLLVIVEYTLAGDGWVRTAWLACRLERR